jgi:NAD(P)-dependent dehydrogenase (short-subunit alcohol dehydrogenase family)
MSEQARVLLITGGGRGIGAATARLGAARGYRVAVNYAGNIDAAEALVAEIERAGGRAVAIRGDVADESQVEQLFAEAERRLGPVSALVNNAGVTGRAGRLDEVSAATVRRVVDVNLLGSMLCARAAVRRMSTVHGGGGGAIVNLSSGAATLGGPGEWVWYAATKGAIDTFTIGLSREVAREGIRVNAVQPGLIDTDMTRPARTSSAARTIWSGPVPASRTRFPARIRCCFSRAWAAPAVITPGKVQPGNATGRSYAPVARMIARAWR